VYSSYHRKDLKCVVVRRPSSGLYQLSSRVCGLVLTHVSVLMHSHVCALVPFTLAFNS